MTNQDNIQGNTKKEEKKELNQDIPKDITPKKEAVMYIGPRFPNLVEANVIYNNGIPNELKELIEKNPAMKKLLVPISQLSKARQKVKEEGSALNILYKETEKLAKKL